MNNKQQMESKILTPEQALELLKQGFEVMVLPYDDDWENLTGIVIEDFEDWSDVDILKKKNKLNCGIIKQKNNETNNRNNIRVEN